MPTEWAQPIGLNGFSSRGWNQECDFRHDLTHGHSMCATIDPPPKCGVKNVISALMDPMCPEHARQLVNQQTVESAIRFEACLILQA